MQSIFHFASYHLFKNRPYPNPHRRLRFHQIDNLLNKQRRVGFADQGHQHHQDNTQFFQDNKLQEWLLRQFSGRMNEDNYYDDDDIEFATAVAAAAFAIHSVEDGQHQTNINITRQGGLANFTRRFSNKDPKVSARRPSDPAFARPKTPSIRRGKFESKADAWEKAKMENIRKRYEKMKSSILAWEIERKMQAKLKRERQQSELDKRRARILQHYQIKIARIEEIAGGAKAQAEEKTRNEQAIVKNKAKIIRAKGQMPVKCFCF